jgi:hypothetical protein
VPFNSNCNFSPTASRHVLHDVLLQLCPPGTQVDRQSGDRCLKCDPGFFNFDGTNCTACPIGAQLP